MSPNFVGTASLSALTTGDKSYDSGMSSVDVGSDGSVSVSAVTRGAGASMSSFLSQAERLMRRTTNPRRMLAPKLAYGSAFIKGNCAGNLNQQSHSAVIRMKLLRR